MKKKIGLILVLVGIFLFGITKGYAVYTPTLDEKLVTYWGPYDNGNNSIWKSVENVYNLDSKKSVKNNGARWEMKVFRTEINGQPVFCLDPGLGVGTSYEIVDSQETRNKLKSNLLFLAAIYKTNFTGLTFDLNLTHNSQTIVINENDDYIIKQFMMWACIADKFSANNYIREDGTFNHIKWNDEVYQDIYRALVSHHKYGEEGASVTELNKEYGLKPEDKKKLARRLQETYNEIKNINGDDINIVLYDTNEPGCQRFIGLRLPNDPTPPSPVEYQVTVKRFLKKGSDGEYVEIVGARETKSCSSGEKVKVDNSLSADDTTYDSSFWVKTDFSSNVDTNTADGGGITFIMPEGNVTVDVYYQVGRIMINYYLYDKHHENPYSIRLDGSGTEMLRNEDRSITFPTSKNYVENGSSDTYYFYRSDLKQNPIPKGKEDITISAFYGLRYYDVKHVVLTTINNATVEESFLPCNKPTEDGSFYNGWGVPGLSFKCKGDPYYGYNTNTARYEKYQFLGSEIKTNLELTKAYQKVSTRTIGALTKENIMDHLDETKIAFYYRYEPSVKIIIRHIERKKNDNGIYEYKELPVNENEFQMIAYQEKGETKYKGQIVSNGYSQRKAKANSDPVLTLNEKRSLFSKINQDNEATVEIYEMDKTGRLVTDRLRTILNENGEYYKCLGYIEKKYVEGTRPDFLDKNLSNELVTDSPLEHLFSDFIDAESGKRIEYVFMDYYYEREIYSNEPTSVDVDHSIGQSASLKFYTKAASDNTSKLDEHYSVQRSADGLEDITYVPATENLKPFVESNLCRAKTLQYQLTELNGSISQTVKNYDAWAIYTDDNPNTISGNVKKVDEDVTVIGEESSGVYDTDRNLYLTNSGQIKADIANTFSKVNHKVLTIFASPVVVSDKKITTMLEEVTTHSNTSDDTFLNHNDYDLSDTKYNGYRKTSGSIHYAVYDILNQNTATRQTEKTDCIIPSKKSTSVNIYTPIEVGLDEIKVDNLNYVDHTIDTGKTITDKFVIQQGTTFNLTVSTKENKLSSPYDAITKTGKYVKEWHVCFNFDVEWEGNTYLAGEHAILTKLASHNDELATTTFRGIKAIGDVTGTTSTLLLQKVKVYASTINIPETSFYETEKRLQNNSSKSFSSPLDSTNRIDDTSIKLRKKDGEYHLDDKTNMTGSAFYLVSQARTSTTIGRIFDFEITDCLDVNFKDVFRNLNEENKVNSSTGTRYYAGTRSLLMVDQAVTSEINLLNEREKIKYGSVLSILPLGPYKHTSNSYLNGVKLGYRFSFDVKTSGYYDQKNKEGVTRSVSIIPSYYYISKDGNTYINDIVLYYKNASGKYVKYDTSHYSIYYKPNDGYRTLAASKYTFDTSVNLQNTLTDKLTSLDISHSNGFTLSNQTSMTTSANQFVQVWYGEFKLPNSTIALDNSNGKVDINQPLTDGYIGVKFEIQCTDEYKESAGSSDDKVVISYTANDKNASPNNNNTSQWDYEGYLEFPRSNLGNPLQNDIKIPLERGIWTIDDEMYQNIKGTVAFYDTDSRAADDYN